jgi:hypothetical protein
MSYVVLQIQSQTLGTTNWVDLQPLPKLPDVRHHEILNSKTALTNGSIFFNKEISEQLEDTMKVEPWR